MNIILPNDFYSLNKKQQESYLVDYLIKYQLVTDDIKKLLGKLRGEHRKLIEDDVN